jgi:peptidoglycan hydrolase-like protein with peptidoglycan-binding domain
MTTVNRTTSTARSTPPQATTSNTPRYDGTKPAPGTTNTNAARPTDPPVRGDPARRNASTYNNVINQFAVGNNPRYTPRDSSGDGVRDTFCNIFVWDVTKAMGAEIPHWVDGKGNPTGVGQGRELSANGTVDWLHQNGNRHGWRKVSAQEAQAMANQGHPAVAVWKNTGGIGHVAVVRPGEVTSQGPAIAQAGARNFNNGHVKDSFGNRPVEYWVNDGGKVDGSPSTPPKPQPTPTTPTTPSKPGGVPQVDLKRGAEGPEVKKLQDALVKLGYMTKEQVATGPGTFGPKTEAAVQKFQGDHGIQPASGLYGPKTRAAMTAELAKLNKPATPSTPGKVEAPAPGLSKGAEGPEVKKLQDAMVKLGYMTKEQVATGPGTFGPKTEAAVKRFQQDQGIQPASGRYGPKTHDALAKALGGGGKPPAGPVDGPTPTTPGTDAAKAAKLDAMLKGSGLQGQGAHMLAMAKKYNVPVELGLAMFWKEAQWNTTGVAPKNNNPGNLRFAEWEKQFGGVPNGGFTKFPSVEKGVEAYFRLLGGPAYRQFVDNKDWAGLVNKYAPPSDGNNSSLYAKQITEWMDKYRAKLNG